MTDAAPWPPPENRSDDEGNRSTWAAPIGPPAPETAPASPYDADPFAAYAPPTAAPLDGGWTPPPKPGLIPLRPLSFGALLGTPFQVLRRNPRPTFGAALLIQGLGSGGATVLWATLSIIAFARVGQADPSDQDTVAAGAVGIAIVSALIPFVVSIASSALVQGLVVLEVSRGILGEKPTMRTLFRRMRGRIWALIGWAAISVVAISAVAVLAVLLAVPLLALDTDSSILTAVLLMLGVGLIAAVLFAWLSTKTALVPSALVLERLGLGRAIARSWRLTRGGFWRTFGVLALMTVIVQAAAQIVSVPVSVLVPLVFALVAPTDPAAQIYALIAVYVIGVALGVVVGAIGTVLSSAAAALVYIDRRMRVEGLDVELLRFTEDRAAGTDSADPFRPDPAPTRSDPAPSGASW